MAGIFNKITFDNTDNINNSKIKEVLEAVQNGKYKSIEELKQANYDIENLFKEDFINECRLKAMLQVWDRKSKIEKDEGR